MQRNAGNTKLPVLSAVLAVLIAVACSDGGGGDGPPDTASPPPVGENGGTISGTSGEQLVIPAGALNGPATVTVTRVSESEAQSSLEVDLAAAGLTFLGAVAVNTNAAFKQPAALSVPFASALPGTSQVLVASVGPDLTGEGKSALILEEIASLDSGRLHTMSPPFPGITGAGTFIFLQPTNAVRFVTGRVVAENAQLLDGAWVTPLEMPSLAARANGGVFVAAVPTHASVVRLSVFHSAQARGGFINVQLPPGSALPPVPVHDIPTSPSFAQRVKDFLDSECADPDFSAKRVLNNLANTALKTLTSLPETLDLVPDRSTTLTPSDPSVTFSGDMLKFLAINTRSVAGEGKISLPGLPKATLRLTGLSMPRLFHMNPHPVAITESAPGVVLQPISATMSSAGVFSFTVTGKQNGSATIVDNGVQFGLTADISWTLSADGEVTRNCVLPGVPLEVKPQTKNIVAGPVMVNVTDGPTIRINAVGCTLDPVGVGHVPPNTQRVRASLSVQGPVGSSARIFPTNQSISVTTPANDCGSWVFGLGNDVNCTRGASSPETATFESTFWCEQNGCPASMEIQAVLFASGSGSPNLARETALVACP